LKKVNKTSSPNALIQYVTDHPDDRWDDFRGHECGTAYASLREQMIQDQGGLCGYCETTIAGLLEHKQRIEHFHAKSDTEIGVKNWDLDWQNIFAVCIGGSDSDNDMHPLPENLSCDAYKEHAIGKSQLPVACEGYVINPLEMPAFPRLMDFDRRTGELKPDAEACAQVSLTGNNFHSTEALVANTIRVLNLNCDRLNQQRREVLFAFEREVKAARRANDVEIFQKLCSRWFSVRWPSFFTTRWALLRDHAEVYLTQIGYDG
jgi:uncharacterized protein (TIGR02646 family)